MEGVATFSGNDVQHRTVGVGVGRDPAGLQHHFLDSGRVELVAAVADTRHVLHPHAVKVDFGSLLAVKAL